ncbi:MAG: hypothetical protein ABSA93_01520, partial [Streptosporangiaceae bacterium]
MHGGDRFSGGVGELDGDLARLRAVVQPDPQCRGAGRVQPDAGPAERQLHAAGYGIQRGSVQRGIQQRRVQPETAGLIGQVLRQPDFGEDFRAALPDRLQAAESGTVPQAHLSEPVIRPLQRDRGGAGRRPVPQAGRGRLSGVAAVQRPAGVAGPGAV